MENIKELNALINRLIALPDNSVLSLMNEDIENFQEISDLDLKAGLDLYCQKCKKTKTFIYDKDATVNTFQSFMSLYLKIINEYRMIRIALDFNEAFKRFYGYFVIRLTCPSCEEHIDMFFNYSDTKITKLSSYPPRSEESLYDQYKILDNGFSYSEELYKAYKMIYSYHAGVASIIYSRRCLEHYVDSKLDEHFKLNNITNSKVTHDSKFKDRVNEVTNDLDSNIVELLKNAYRYMSISIHNLDEKQCITDAPILLNFVELILDQEIAEVNKKEAIKKTKDFIKRTTTK